MIKAKVNDKHDYTITENDEQIEINGEAVTPDVFKVDERRMHLLLNNKSYNVEIMGYNEEEKTYSILVNGQRNTVAIKDRFDILLEKMGMADLAANKVNDIKAPMPGLVLKVLVEVGTEFKKGDAVLILEAMKMENVLKAPADGVVHSIEIKAGDKVEKNQVMIVLEK
jgi:biotin carboxyl carrier protein